MDRAARWRLRDVGVDTLVNVAVRRMLVPVRMRAVAADRRRRGRSPRARYDARRKDSRGAKKYLR